MCLLSTFFTISHIRVGGCRRWMCWWEKVGTFNVKMFTQFVLCALHYI